MKRWVMNLQSRHFNDDETSVFAKGLNFAMAPRRIPVAHIVAVVEDGFRRVGSEHTEAVDRVRCIIVGILQKAKPPATNFTRDNFTM